MALPKINSAKSEILDANYVAAKKAGSAVCFIQYYFDEQERKLDAKGLAEFPNNYSTIYIDSNDFEMVRALLGRCFVSVTNFN